MSPELLAEAISPCTVALDSTAIFTSFVALTTGSLSRLAFGLGPNTPYLFAMRAQSMLISSTAQEALTKWTDDASVQCYVTPAGPSHPTRCPTHDIAGWEAAMRCHGSRSTG